MKSDFYLEVRPSTTVPVAETMTVEVIGLTDQEVKISSFTAPELEQAQILSSKIGESVKGSDGEWKSNITFEVLPLAPGTLEFPALKISLDLNSQGRTDLLSPPISIAVVNPIETTESPPPLRDIKDPVSSGTNPWLFLYVALILAALGGLYWFYRRRKRSMGVSVPSVPMRPAHLVALEKLEEAMQNYRKNLDVRIFYWNLSQAFREYIHHRYSMDALEATTSEIYAGLRKQFVDAQVCSQTREILSACDLVKFAKWVPSESALEDDFMRAKNFVEFTQKIPSSSDDQVSIQ